MLEQHGAVVSSWPSPLCSRSEAGTPRRALYPLRHPADPNGRVTRHPRRTVDIPGMYSRTTFPITRNTSPGHMPAHANRGANTHETTFPWQVSMAQSGLRRYSRCSSCLIIFHPRCIYSVRSRRMTIVAPSRAASFVEADGPPQRTQTQTRIYEWDHNPTGDVGAQDDGASMTGVIGYPSWCVHLRHNDICSRLP